MDQQAERSLDRQLGALVLRDVGGDQFTDPEFLQIVFDDRMGAEDELVEEGAGAPTGLRDHTGGSPSWAGRARAFRWRNQIIGS